MITACLNSNSVSPNFSPGFEAETAEMVPDGRLATENPAGVSAYLIR